MIAQSIYPIVAGASAVTALLGTSPVRFFPAGEATQGTPSPYAVYQTISGVPENYLGDAPDADSYSVQIDTYADTLAAAVAVRDALRDTLQDHGYITGWRGESRDPVTRRYRSTFSFEFFTGR